MYFGISHFSLILANVTFVIFGLRSFPLKTEELLLNMPNLEIAWEIEVNLFSSVEEE